jgi:[acyl-carrier-protein] S-malonyltransferase
MVEQGVTRFIEVGPKDVLSKLVKRIDRSVETISIGDADSMEVL